jgi:hypothetical protein
MALSQKNATGQQSDPGSICRRNLAKGIDSSWRLCSWVNERAAAVPELTEHYGGDLNCRALTPACHRLVRTSTRPRVGLERYVRQSVAIPRIADLAEAIYQQSAAWAAAPPRRSDCTSLLSPVVQAGPERY